MVPNSKGDKKKLLKNKKIKILRSKGVGQGFEP
jgi:hypothetical protein